MILSYEIAKSWVSKLIKIQKMYGKQKFFQLFLKNRKVSINMRGASRGGCGEEGSVASRCGGYHYRIITVSFHGLELSVLVKMHATDRNYFNILFKIDSFCRLKFFSPFLRL